jgi:Holliday junction resolvasome RuvABC ATP-dependent DNA helicase subunit
MINLRLLIRRGDLATFTQTLETAIVEHIDEIHYIDFYNLRFLVQQLERKRIEINLYDPFKPIAKRPLNIKININVANTYIKIISLPSILTDDYAVNLHRETVNDLDRQIKNLCKIV